MKIIVKTYRVTSVPLKTMPIAPTIRGDGASTIGIRENKMCASKPSICVRRKLRLALRTMVQYPQNTFALVATRSVITRRALAESSKTRTICVTLDNTPCRRRAIRVACNNTCRIWRSKCIGEKILDSTRTNEGGIMYIG